MKLLMLTRYGRLGASSRQRSLAFLPALEAAGFEVTVAPFFEDDYIRALYAGQRVRAGQLAAWYLRRVTRLRSLTRFDRVWIEVEALPWLPHALERWLLRDTPYILDCDDAWFHRYGLHGNPLIRWSLGRKIDRGMARSSAVLAGSHYIAERARAVGARRVELVPTVVGLERYPLRERPESGPCVIGWIGTPLTTRYLSLVARPLAEVCVGGGARLRLIGAGDYRLPGVEAEPRPWSEDSEAEELAAIDIGIMPLFDSPWERGKCGYKLIQYMAAGRPCVASRVGENGHLLRDGETGYLAADAADWAAALRRLCADAALRARLGTAGRRLVERHYCVEVMAPRLIELLSAGG